MEQIEAPMLELEACNAKLDDVHLTFETAGDLDGVVSMLRDVGLEDPAVALQVCCHSFFNIGHILSIR
jgi:hypothetical protein